MCLYKKITGKENALLAFERKLYPAQVILCVKEPTFLLMETFFVCGKHFVFSGSQYAVPRNCFLSNRHVYPSG